MDKDPYLGLAPVRSCGMLLSKTALSLVLLAKDREADSVKRCTQECINDGLFWERAAKFEVPGLPMDRVEEAIEWLGNRICPHEVADAEGFSGKLTFLFPERIRGQKPDYRNETVYGHLYWIALAHGPSLTDAPYASPDAIVAEMKSIFPPKWPDFFPWWEHLVEIYGIYEC